MPPTLNPSIYSKRKPFELSPFLLHEHVLSLFSRSFIFSLHSLYKFHVSCFVFSHCYRLLPTSLSKALQNEEFVSMKHWLAQTYSNIWIRSDEGLTLETSAFQSLYGGQFTLSTPLINQIYVYHSPTDAAPQFLQKLIPFTQILIMKLWIVSSKDS